MPDQLLSRILALKTTIVALVTAAIGGLLMVLAHFSDTGSNLTWLRVLPVSDLGSTLFITGAFVVAWDFADSRDRELREDARLRRLLSESAPLFRDAVIAGFAADTEDLRRVATPEVLDGLATNAMALRLGDHQFAEEIYTDVRDQAIRAPERWHDVDIKVHLSSRELTPGESPLFDVLVEWEYTVTPSHAVQRFACVSDRDEFYELVTDVPATSTWFMTPRPGLNAAERESFELLSFSVDGEERHVRRSARATGQTYSAVIGAEVVAAGEPVRIRHVYRTRTPRSGHRLFFEIAQPARDVSLELDYTATDISRLSVTDLVTSLAKPRITRLPQQQPAKVLGVEVPGWLLPRSGFTFVWTLSSEETELALPTDPTGSAPGGAGLVGVRASSSRRRSSGTP